MRDRSPRTPVLLICLLASGALPGLGAPAPSSEARGAVTPSADLGDEALAGILRRAEYRFSPRPDGSWSAPNRAHDLRIRTTPGGARIVSRTGATGPWEISLGLQAFGRPGALRHVSPGSLVADEARIERYRSGITEWLVNKGAGLEHGFTIREAPEIPAVDSGSGDGSAAPVVLRIRLSGSLKARLHADGTGITLSAPGGRELLRYDGLKVTDAAGDTIPARMDLDGGSLLILIDDGGAAYPLDVDPLLTSAAWTFTGPGDDLLGFSIATAGDVNGDGYSDVLMGATYYDAGLPNTGAAFLFHGGPFGPSANADWSAIPTLSGSEFAHSLSAAGDVNGDGYGDIIVGAPLWSNGAQYEGKAFVWLGGAAGLGSPGDESSADWSYEGGLAGSYLGLAVADAGDVNGNGYDDVIIGSPGWSNGEANEGRALVFLGVPGGLASLPAWTAESGQACASPPACSLPQFGSSVAGAGDVNADGYDDILVGAPGYDDATDEAEGYAFLWQGASFFGTGPDGNPGNAQWWGQGNQDNSQFGYSVAPAGDVDGDGYADVIIGAWGWDGSFIDEGAAFVWKGGPLGLGPVGHPGNVWWVALGAQQGAGLGKTVGSAGDVNGDGFADLFTGSSSYDTLGQDDGGAWVWLGGASGPAIPVGSPLNADWSASSGQTFSGFGDRAAAAGDVDGDGFGDFMVSAFSWEAGAPGTSNGRVWIYRGAPDGPSLTADITLEGNQGGAGFGLSVASAGDVNGDGFDELIVGAPFFDNGEVDEGQAFLFIGSGGGLFLSPSWIVQGDQQDATLGISVSSAGDVNGDGFDDVVLGAPGHVKSLPGEGGVFVFHGGPASGPDPSGMGGDGSPASADWQSHGGVSGAGMGRAVARAGDVNGDGFGDIIAGAPFLSNGESQEGKVWVFPGSTLGLAGTLWSREMNAVGAHFGQAVASAGDVNADGFSDILVGAPFHTSNLLEEGRAELYLGSGLGPSIAPDWFYESPQAESHAGRSVSSAGDVNGDGFSDWMVGMPDFEPTGMIDTGLVQLFYGTGGALPTANGWYAGGSFDLDRLGVSVAPAGDLNLDGYADILAGAPTHSGVTGSEGFVAVWLGGPGGPVPSGSFLNNDWIVEGQVTAAQFGFSVASAGDVNGDGFPEIVVGSPFFAAPDAGEGGVFLYMGNGVEGLHRIPVQARADDTARLGPLARSGSDSGVTLRALGRSSAGRAGVRLQWETEPLGQPFDGAGLDSGPVFLDSGVPDFLEGSAEPLSEAVSGLSTGTFFHWRLRVASDNPRHPWTPWMSPSFNSAQETDFRTDGCVDRDGDGYGVVPDPSCPGGLVLDCDDGRASVHPGHSELCDGLDNNCDGTTDEGNPQGGGNCNTGLPGVCVAGSYECLAGSLVCMEDTPPSPEVCDGLDNNCDGTIDEGNPGGGAACSTGQPGVCGPGTETCLGGSITCRRNVNPSAEACNGLDDDCDGAIPDEELDGDLDGLSQCEGDCDDKDSFSIATPGPVTGLTAVYQNPGYTLVWDSQQATAGRGTVYDVYGGPVSDIRPTGDFSTGSCAAEDEATPSWDDQSPDPAPGEAFYFVIRGQNGCPVGTGTFGNNYRDAGNAASSSPCG